MPHDLFRSAYRISLTLIQAHRQLPFRQVAAENGLCTLRPTVAGPSEAELSEKATYDRQPGGWQEMTLRPPVPVHCPPAAVCARNIATTFHSNEFSLIYRIWSRRDVYMKGTRFLYRVKYKIFYQPKDTRQNGTVGLYIVTSSFNLTCTLCYVACYSTARYLKLSKFFLFSR